jgi:hypothetical protein
MPALPSPPRGVRWALLALAAAAVNVLTWPVATLAPGTGLDPSWQIALHLAAERRMAFGDEIGFTYGPLGFLVVPQLVTSGTGAVAFAATFLIRTALVLAVLVAARRAFGSLPVGLAVTYALAALVLEIVEMAGLLALLVGLLLVQTPVRGRAGRLVAAGLGAGAGTLLLVKFNVGTLAVLATLTAAVFQAGRRRTGVACWAAGFAGAVAVLWPATGNAPGDLWTWLSWSVSISAGWTGATMLEQPGGGRDWEDPAYLLTALALLALAAVGTRGRDPARRAAVLGLLAVGLWVTYKHGFVRHDPHAVFSFAVLATLPVAVLWRGTALRAAALALVVLGTVFTVRSAGLGTAPVLSPEGKPGRFADQVALLADGGDRRAAIAAAKEAVRAQLGVDPALVAAAGTEGVHVAPHEVSAAWAYGLRWDPVPHFQSFSTWTPALDRVNARHLRGPGAPRYVLREDIARYDGHNPLWESPAENLALICGYRQVRAAGRWELLERTGDRCGPARPAGDTTTRVGAFTPVPAAGPGEVVWAEADRRPGPWERLRALVYKPERMPEFRLRPDTGLGLTARIPAALLGGPLVLRGPVTSSTPPRLARYLRVGEWVPWHPETLEVRYLRAAVAPAAAVPAGAAEPAVSRR